LEKLKGVILTRVLARSTRVSQGTVTFITQICMTCRSSQPGHELHAETMVTLRAADVNHVPYNRDTGPHCSGCPQDDASFHI